MIDYLLFNTGADLLAYNKNYYAQVQFNMVCTNTNWANWVAYDPRINNFDLGMVGYYIRKVGTLLADYWNNDSSIWDLEAGTGTLAYLMERIEKDPKKQFAVIVDFHH
jgi:hypothetical protein